MGRTQFSCLRDRDTVRYLRWLLEHVQQGKIWRGDGHKFRQFFARMLDRMNLGGINLKPASLRPGGTTWLFLEGMPVHTIQFHGRWRNAVTMQTYVQECTATLAMSSLPSAVTQCMHLCLRQCTQFWIDPPSLSFGHLLSVLHGGPVSRGAHAFNQ